MTIENLQQNLIQDFEFFEDWTQKYEYMIELSKGLDKMDQEMKSDKNIIKGCQSKVWLHADYSDGKIKFLADKKSKDQLLIFPCTNSGYGVGEEGVFCNENTPMRVCNYKSVYHDYYYC